MRFQFQFWGHGVGSYAFLAGAPNRKFAFCFFNAACWAMPGGPGARAAIAPAAPLISLPEVLRKS
jgi:hypothetical protein